MKKIISVISILMIALCLFSCARKTKPPFVIKHESVESVDFKRTVYSADDPSVRSYVQKSVTAKEDVEDVLCWIEKLKLEKHDAIEVPIEKVQYVIVLNGIKDHKLVFMDQYVVYDSTAYTYKDSSQMSEVANKYNLLNYEQKDTKLDLIK